MSRRGIGFLAGSVLTAVGVGVLTADESDAKKKKK
jgi:hypothetical protein